MKHNSSSMWSNLDPYTLRAQWQQYTINPTVYYSSRSRKNKINIHLFESKLQCSSFHIPARLLSAFSSQDVPTYVTILYDLTHRFWRLLFLLWKISSVALRKQNAWSSSFRVPKEFVMKSPFLFLCPKFSLAVLHFFLFSSRCFITELELWSRLLSRAYGG